MIQGYVSLTYVAVIVLFSLVNVLSYGGWFPRLLPSLLPDFLTVFVRLVFLCNITLLLVGLGTKVTTHLPATRPWSHFD